MAQRGHVPEFGNWDQENNAAYTGYFDNARKGRSGAKMINPNDPEENPDILTDAGAPAADPPSRAKAETAGTKGPGVGRTMHGSDDGSLNQDNMGGLSPYEPRGRRASHDEPPRRPARPSAGSDNSVEKSPMHPHARISGRGGSSPSWEAKGSRDNSHGMATPGRSRLGSTAKGEDIIDKGAAVPKFGEWNENDPASAEGYTHIFNRVREERQGGARPNMYSQSPYAGAAARGPASDNSKCCCFPWLRK